MRPAASAVTTGFDAATARIAAVPASRRYKRDNVQKLVYKSAPSLTVHMHLQTSMSAYIVSIKQE